MDYITFIYSLTFFFKDEETLDNLVKLIDNSLIDGGLIIGQVMDGKRLLDSASDKSIYSEVKKIGLFDCAPFNIKLEKNKVNKESNGIAGKVFININDPISLVHDQWEYIVDFEKFAKKLSNVGIMLQETGFLDKEAKLLNKCPAWFTRLARWFVFKKN